LVAIIATRVGEHVVPQRLKGTNAYNRAQVFNERGDVKQAEQLYRRAIDENPKLAAAYNNLGLLLADINRLEQAQPLLVKAIELEPNDPSAHTNLGLVFARQGDLDSAIASFRSALALDAQNTAAKYNLAAALAMQGHNDQAVEVLRTFASPNSPDPFARRAAQMLQRLGPAAIP
jgi:tetratricopeptide (TPR) repeat protein